MTFTINIENGTSLYTAEDIIRYNDAGLLYCHDVCLSSVIDKIVEYYEDRIFEVRDEEYEKGREKGYTEGRESAISEIRGFIQSM